MVATTLRDRLLDMLKRLGKLFVDETVAPVLDPGRGRTKRGQLWTYARDDRPWCGSDPPAVTYRYALDRKAEQLIEHFAGFRGVLQIDGYAAYGRLARIGDVQLGFFWTHVTRRFFERAATGTSPVAIDVLTCIAQLYAVEADICGQLADDRCAVRQERSRVIIDQLRRVLDIRLGQISRKGGLAEAMHYALCIMHYALGRALPLPRRRTCRIGFQHRRAQHSADNPQPQEHAFSQALTMAETTGRSSPRLSRPPN